MGDIESLELYVEARNSEHDIQLGVSPTNLGTEFALSVARRANMDGTTKKRIYTKRMCSTCYSGKFGETSSPLIRRSEFCHGTGRNV